jgi:5-(carboxyamino)imidazole ribonucleotide mutase
MNPLVYVIMGSNSDFPTMINATRTLKNFNVPHDCKIISAHRTPDLLFEFAKNAKSQGIEVIIAGAGGAAHLPGMCASQTTLPVIGVPIQSKLNGLDSLLSIVQMPTGIPVATVAIGAAENAALLAISILANKYEEFAIALDKYRKNQEQTVLNHSTPKIYVDQGDPGLIAASNDDLKRK